MLKRLLVIALLGIAVIVVFRHAGSFLVVNDPKPADLIVVLGGGNNDLRYWNGVRLMQEGYAHHLMLDVFAKGDANAAFSRARPGRAGLGGSSGVGWPRCRGLQ